jgi:hypothetical protein
MHLRPQEAVSIGDESYNGSLRLVRHGSYITRVMSWSRLSLTLAGRSMLRPTLAVALLRVAWRFRSRDWYRRFPFLPLPDATYVRWRMYTAYGDYDAIPPAADVERYALWAVHD